MSNATATPTVVVTGAARGIGFAVARRFGTAGYLVALLDRELDAVQTAADKLGAEGIQAYALVCDVTSEQQCASALAEVVKLCGGVDVLVNNAGITHLSSFAETSMETYRRVFDVNVFGAVQCTQAALPSLVERGGTVVVISSVAGFSPLARRSGYSASKHALHGMFETARSELAPEGVHVMMVCPGFTRTGIEDAALSGAVGRPRERRSTVGRIAEPNEVAEAIYQGVVRRRRLIVLSTVGKVARLFTRLAPGLYERVMARSLARSLARQSDK